MNQHVNDNQREVQEDKFFASFEYLIEQKLDAELTNILDTTPSLINITAGSGKKLLHAATIHKNFEIMNYLITEGCEIDAKTTGGLTPLMIAADSNEPILSKMLLDNDADIFATNFEGKTALHIYLNSLSCRRLPIIEEFFEKLENRNVKNEDLFAILENGSCRLDELVHLRNVELTKMFLDKQGKFLNNRLPVCDVYIKPDGKIDFSLPDNEEYYLTAGHEIYVCLAFGYDENLKIILDYGVNVDYYRNLFIKIFYVFVRQCESDIFLKNINKYVQLMIDLKLINHRRIMEIDELFRNVNEKALCELLKTNLNSYIKKKCDHEPFAMVFGNSRPGILKLIQKEKLEEKFRDIAIYIAIMYCNEGHVRYLLEKNFDPNMTDKYGIPPIFYVINVIKAHNMNSFLKLLLQYNADIQFFRRNGTVCLDYLVDDPLDLEQPLKTIVAHLAILESCDVPIEAPFMDFIYSIEFLSNFYETACQQLEQMKMHKIDRSLTLFAILTQSYVVISERVKAMEPDTVKSLCSSTDNILAEYDDYYVDIIRDRLMLAYKIQETKKKAETVIHDCIDQLKGQWIAIHEICSYLSYQHLHKIVYPSHEVDCKKCKVLNLACYRFAK